MRVLSYSKFFPYADFPLRVMRLERHGSNALHSHEFTELVFVTSGRACHLEAGRPRVVEAGDAFVIHEGAAHRYEADDEFGIINILFSKKRLPVPDLDLFMLPGWQLLFGDKNAGKIIPFRLAPPRLAEAMSVVGELEAELAGRPPGYQYAAVSVFMRLVLHLSRFVLMDSGREAESWRRAGGLMRFLNENYNRDISLEEMCDKAGMSPSSLTRYFRKTLGCSPVDYLIRLRVSNAMEILRTTTLSIAEVGRRAGFPDANYFARQFRKIAGLSPGAFRSDTRSVPLQR